MDCSDFEATCGETSKATFRLDKAKLNSHVLNWNCTTIKKVRHQTRQASVLVTKKRTAETASQAAYVYI